MKTPMQIIDELGREAIVVKLDVTLARVNRARNERLLAASWYDGLCKLAGHDLPRELFSFKPRGDQDSQDTAP